MSKFFNSKQPIGLLFIIIGVFAFLFLDKQIAGTTALVLISFGIGIIVGSEKS